MRHRSSRKHCDPLPNAGAVERPGFILGGERLGRGHAKNANVTTSWDRLNSILSLTANARKEARAEADEKFGHLHAESFGQEEVSGFVEHDGRQKRNNESHNSEYLHAGIISGLTEKGVLEGADWPPP